MSVKLRGLAFLGCSLVLGFGILGCEVESLPTETDPEGTVEGHVTIDGEDANGITVTLSGSTSRTTTTASNGRYAFHELVGGSYTVSISGYPSSVTFPYTAATASVTSETSELEPVIVGFDGQSWESLAGGTWEADYAMTSSTCEQTVLEPYSVGAQGGAEAEEDVITLWFQFEEGQPPVTGPLDLSDLTFAGETGPVDLGQGVTANEMWPDPGAGEFQFVFVEDEEFVSPSGGGTSLVVFRQDGEPLCERRFDLEIRWIAPDAE